MVAMYLVSVVVFFIAVFTEDLLLTRSSSFLLPSFPVGLLHLVRHCPHTLRCHLQMRHCLRTDCGMLSECALAQENTQKVGFVVVCFPVLRVQLRQPHRSADRRDYGDLPCLKAYRERRPFRCGDVRVLGHVSYSPQHEDQNKPRFCILKEPQQNRKLER